VPHRGLAVLAAWWGVSGVLLLLTYAIVRLAPVALDALRGPLGWHHWALLVINVAFMAYSEGYRGFQRSFSPRVATRAAHLGSRPTLLRTILAPLYCAGYFAAPRRVRIMVYSITAAVLLLVQVLHYLAQPWRGILDTGVVVGLAWGVVATFVIALRELGAAGLGPRRSPG